ncbi:MAG: hypothetical protein PHR24_02025 [Oscillospiraceae bacterium]|nr:hypothetical protein [Oscillospiraceae bacterium]MDD3832860.1 hypothetical protein [Oscillospiraceae bacterium]MDD4546058.1 hypothetical protein [Oscillospiraceae bacterium]
MDDLAQKISELLGSPDGVQKLQAAAASLGMLTDNKTEPSAQPVSAMLPSAPETAASMSGGDLEVLQRLVPLVSGFKQDSQDTVLLKAIRPYLQDERQRRVDDAVKIMHMLKVLPNFKL